MSISGVKGIRKGPIRAEKPMGTVSSDENGMITHGDGTKSETLGHKKLRIMKVAKELFYPKIVIDRIFNAESKHEIDRIMTSARHGMYG